MKRKKIEEPLQYPAQGPLQVRSDKDADSVDGRGRYGKRVIGRDLYNRRGTAATYTPHREPRRPWVRGGNEAESRFLITATPLTDEQRRQILRQRESEQAQDRAD